MKATLIHVCLFAMFLKTVLATPFCHILTLIHGTTDEATPPRGFLISSLLQQQLCTSSSVLLCFNLRFVSVDSEPKNNLRLYFLLAA